MNENRVAKYAVGNMRTLCVARFEETARVLEKFIGLFDFFRNKKRYCLQGAFSISLIKE